MVMYDVRMPPDATDTKRRLLKAATDEFAQHGLAGGRVDRIADTAGANKRSIYMHFGAKEELFDRVVAECMRDLAQAITLDDGDVPRYAAELFDRLQVRPHVSRLYRWASLERQHGIDSEVTQYRERIAAIEAAQKSGQVRDDISPVELLAMVLAMVLSWDTAAWSLKELAPVEPDPAQRRAALVAGVTSLIRP
ncbi:TetR family transcriptional regulator [Catenuloplanes niger JCM 9533]